MGRWMFSKHWERRRKSGTYTNSSDLCIRDTYHIFGNNGFNWLIQHYLAGVMKIDRVPVHDVFGKKPGVQFFRATMSSPRFRFLTNCLRFDDRQTRAARRKERKLAPIKDIFDHIIKTSRELYTSLDTLTIDEQLLGYRGRCPFKTYMKTKPDKYGIKFMLMCKYQNRLNLFRFPYRFCMPDHYSGNELE